MVSLSSRLCLPPPEEILWPPLSLEVAAVTPYAACPVRAWRYCPRPRPSIYDAAQVVVNAPDATPLTALTPLLMSLSASTYRPL